MSMRRALIAFSLAVAALPPAGAAGPHDGTWQGASIGSFGPNCATEAALAVQGDRVRGRM